MRNQLADLEKSKYNEDKLKKEGLFEFFDGSATNIFISRSFQIKFRGDDPIWWAYFFGFAKIWKKPAACSFQELKTLLNKTRQKGYEATHMASWRNRWTWNGPDIDLPKLYDMIRCMYIICICIHNRLCQNDVIPNMIWIWLCFQKISSPLMIISNYLYMSSPSKFSLIWLLKCFFLKAPFQARKVAGVKRTRPKLNGDLWTSPRLEVAYITSERGHESPIPKV